MWVIHKQPLQDGINHISLPLGTELLHAGIQGATPILWYRRPVKAPALENRILLLTGTGQEETDASIGSRWKFISTMLTENQAFVFHVFELVPDRVVGTKYGYGEQLVGEGR